MIKAILISIGFIFCGYILGPAPVSALVHNQAIAKSLNFTVITNDFNLTQKVIRKVDRYVKEITEKWLNGPIPKGMRHTTIRVYIRPYTRAWCTQNQQIYIYTDLEHLDTLLKHELTHALLSIRYPNLPRWTHEGCATTYDGLKYQKMYNYILTWSRRSGTYPRLKEMMKGFNNHNTTAYTASNSLVKFLLQHNDRYTLFLYSTGKCTLERAYGFSSIYELQRAWVKWLNKPVKAIKPSE